MDNVLAGFGLDINNLEDIQSRFEQPAPKTSENNSSVTGLEALSGFKCLEAGLETLNGVSSSATKPNAKKVDPTNQTELLKALDRELDPNKRYVKHTSLNEVKERSNSRSQKDKDKCKSSSNNQGSSPKKLPDGWSILSTDAEYIPITNYPTIPLTVQFADSAGLSREYLHPNHPYSDNQLKELRKILEELGESDALHVFRAPNAILDYYHDIYGIEWRESPNPNKRRYIQTIDLHIFFSFKDLEFTFNSKEEYVFYCLERLERIRRITTKFNRPIPLPYEMRLPNKKGKLVWKSIALNILDVSAMQGSKGLETYLGNVGMSTDGKTEYERWEKSRMDLRLLENSAKFLRYIRSDVGLHTVRVKTIQFYNRIAQLIGVEPRDDWGMSTGKITANMISDWIATQVNLPVTDLYFDEEKGEITTKNTGKLAIKGLYNYNRLSSPESIRELSHLIGNKKLLYLGMTDGGRCVKERVLIDSLKGVLVDIDIMSCYASGLLNQTFPVGNPKIIFNRIKYKDWEKKYSKKLVPGLWSGRISWENAPFKQDLLISKEEKQFTAWDYYQRQFGENDTNDYDASMYLMLNTVHQAAYTHDHMQVIHNYASNQELNWIRENAYIESFAFYAKNEEIDELEESLLLIESFDKFGKGGLKYKTKWKSIPLKKVMSILINRRQAHKQLMKHYEEISELKPIDYECLENLPWEVKKYWKEIGELESRIKNNNFVYNYSTNDLSYHSSIQEFIKLIGNTVYGCIASAFFAGEGTGISNYIVGNNITGRARTLAWCMAKGLHSLMSITDGGVFDTNKVLSYRRKSLDIFANVAFEYFSNENDRKKVVDIVPLYPQEIPFDENMSKILLDKTNDKANHVENITWLHLKNTFEKLDIFSQDQFSFEVKKVYTECILRNKSDYILTNEFATKEKDKENIKIRGIKRANNGSDKEMVKEIFDSIQNKKGKRFTQKSRRMLGLGEWRTREELRKELLPHDEIESTKDFFSLTPLGCRFINPVHRKSILTAYDKARITKDDKAVARIKELETMRVWTSRPDGFEDKSSV